MLGNVACLKAQIFIHSAIERQKNGGALFSVANFHLGVAKLS